MDSFGTGCLDCARLVGNPDTIWPVFDPLGHASAKDSCLADHQAFPPKVDVLVVWKLDRLSRSLRDVLTIMERFGEAGAGFRSLTEAIDTTTPAVE